MSGCLCLKLCVPCRCFFGTKKEGNGCQHLPVQSRSLLRRKPVVLADEITASLDADNAQEIRNILQNLPVTVIEIAHKYKPEQYDALYRLEQYRFIRQ